MRFASLMVAAIFAGNIGAQQSTGIRIVDFAPEARTLKPGDSAISSLVIVNDGPAPRRVWVGYSVQDPGGTWLDVAPRAVEVGAHERSDGQRMEWPVPTTPSPAAGQYRVIMAVWSGAPGSAGSERLVSVDKRNAFAVMAPAVGLSDEWNAGDHHLGRGRVVPTFVQRTLNGFELSLKRASFEGAELRSVARFHYGEYSARMRTPRAPGSISAFFLYADTPGGNDEIDIEVYNDGRRRAILTAWIAGKQSRSTEIDLPFDPSDSAHEYTIRWSESALEFLIDANRVGGWKNRSPHAPMRLMANVWWPTWIHVDDRANIDAEGKLEIEAIRITSQGAPRQP